MAKSDDVLANTGTLAFISFLPRTQRSFLGRHVIEERLLHPGIHLVHRGKKGSLLLILEELGDAIKLSLYLCVASIKDFYLVERVLELSIGPVVAWFIALLHVVLLPLLGSHGEEGGLAMRSSSASLAGLLAHLFHHEVACVSSHVADLMGGLGGWCSRELTASVQASGCS
jgi:hypothetical protein